MTPVELVCAILAQKDIARMGVVPCEHTERLRRNLEMMHRPAAAEIVERLWLEFVKTHSAQAA
jgi:hypothetical protein